MHTYAADKPEDSQVATFRKRLLAGEPLIGTWLKTPHPVIVEVLALAGVDVICVDAEHAPFGRAEIDACVMAARLMDLPTVVRVPAADPHLTLAALDMGATGVVVPHIRTAAEAEALVKSCRYGSGGRGYAGSTRAAGYATRPMKDVIASGNNDVVVMAQLEDAEALDNLPGLMGVDGIDAYFIGPADLSVSMGINDTWAPQVTQAISTIAAAGRAHDKRLATFLANTQAVPKWRAEGISMFWIASDHAFLMQGAKDMMKVKG